MKRVFSLLLFFVIPFLVISYSIDLTVRQDAQPAQRFVYIIGDVSATERAVSAKTGKTIFGMHTGW